jgi:hypothetical protein
MAEQAGVIKNVSYVCMSVIDEMGGDISDMLWLMRRAYSWLSDTMPAKSAYPSIRQIRIDVNSVNQAALPPDFVRYTKIAIDLGGKLWTLGLDNSITLPTNIARCTPDQDISNQDSSTGVWFSPFYGGGRYFGAVYSVGGGFNDAYYRINQENNCIQFLGAVPRGGKLVMEYISNNVDANEFTLVPTVWIDAMRWWLIYKLCDTKPKKYSLGITNPKVEYEIAKAEAQCADGPTMEEILDAYWSGSGFTLR